MSKPNESTTSTNLRQLQLQCQVPQLTLEAAEPDSAEGNPIPRFSMIAYTGDAMRIEGWRHPIVVDLEGVAIPSQRRPVRFGHSMYAGVGHTERIAVEGGRLIAEGIISRDTNAAREVVASGKRGFPWQASIGANVQDSEFIKASQTVHVNGRVFEGPLVVARRTTLGEISFVDLGADGNTTATIAATQSAEHGAQETDVMNDHDNDNENTQSSAARLDHEHTTRDATDAPATDGRPRSMDAAAPVAPVAPVPPVVPVAPDQDVSNDAVAGLRAEALAETRRIHAVRSVCNGRYNAIEERAIGEGWSRDRTELEVLRASRPQAPAVHARDQHLNNRTLEAACALAGKISAIENHYDDQTLETASKRFRGGISLQELLLEAAWANGFDGRNFRDSRGVLRHAFGRDIQAAYSTIDIGGILSNVANKFLLEGFFSVERTWRNITSVRNVSDFKTVTSYRLIGKDQYEIVAPGGEIKHGTLGEESYSNKADTYGLMLSIDRRDIINDDLGAITTVPRKLGRGSGLKINDVFWSIFLANSQFFKTQNKNYLSGADTALSIDGLTKAEVAFMNQVDGDGKPLGVMPAIILVPPALTAMASMLHKSLELRDTTASTKYPVANPHTGKFRSEVSRYLSNSHYTGSSDKAWYLLSEPSDMPVIEVAFLNGQESPTIESAEADFNVLGIQMRGYHDFGVGLQEPRGGVKLKGEA